MKKSLLTIALAFCTLSFTVRAHAQTFTSLYSLCSQTNCTDGGSPSGPLVQGPNGDLYGESGFGGASGLGVIFTITTAGDFSTLYTFCTSSPCSDGSSPWGGLVLAADGNFYGATAGGGAYVHGTIFKITPAGKLTKLHDFDGTDGGEPQAALVQAPNGNLYGTTIQGGANNQGSVFEITTSGAFTSVYSFCASSGCPDGYHPNGLMLAADGNLYGTTYGGGELSGCRASNTNGTFFQLTPSGTLTTLATFCAPTGDLPDSTLVQGANGNFYATTLAGGDGTLSGDGTVYEMTSTGSVSLLHGFCLQTGCPDGKQPMDLALGTDGNFYGVDLLGGESSGKGTIFEITPAGQLTTLYTFTPNTHGDYTDGSDPNTLLLDTNGTFYGTTEFGGKTSNGTIFSLDTGLAPFVRTIPTSGAVGTNVTILGTNLKGASAVSFNGIAATFKVVSVSEITTTVPSGATSGAITVTASNGAKLNSYATFQVP